MTKITYDRAAAVAYARNWAFSRNPRYTDFSNMGGDCTNFVSQCLLAGGMPMNFDYPSGWFYNSSRDRAPAFTSVEYLHKFLTRNGISRGPFAVEVVNTTQVSAQNTGHDTQNFDVLKGTGHGAYNLPEGAGWSRIEVGDIAQLSFENHASGTPKWGHSLLVVGIDPFNLLNPLTATHTFDALDRPLRTYTFNHVRVLHIQGGWE